MGEARFHFLCLHNLEGFLNQHVLYGALLFNMHKPHCLTDYCEVVESQISYPKWEKSFLAYRNAPILLSRQNFYKYYTRTDILKSNALSVISVIK